jgi:hypothetical protein
LNATDYLTFAEVEAFDPNHPRNTGGETRACCPRCGDSKPVDGAHRCLQYNDETGLYRCYRGDCLIKGKFREYWEPKTAPKQHQNSAPSRFNRRGSKEDAMAAFFARPTPKPRPVRVELPPADPSPDFRKRLGNTIPVAESPAATAYLAGRGFDLSDPDIASAFARCYVRYAKDYMVSPSSWGHEAIVFPMVDASGKLIATNGRLLHPKSTQPKAYSIGRKSEAVFMTPGALTGSALVIVEAPFDAMALFVCGVPAVALAGTNPIPSWLYSAARGKLVLFAFDNDEAGKIAARKHKPSFKDEGAIDCKWWHPDAAKDWNECLTLHGRLSMRGFIEDKAKLFRPGAVTPPVPAPVVDDLSDIPAEIIQMGEELDAGLKAAEREQDRFAFARRVLAAVMRDASKNKLPKPLPAAVAELIPSGRGKKLGKAGFDPNPFVSGASRNHDFARDMQDAADDAADDADDMTKLAYWQGIGDREISDICYLATCYNADGNSWLPLPKVYPELVSTLQWYAEKQGGSLCMK